MSRTTPYDARKGTSESWLRLERHWRDLLEGVHDTDDEVGLQIKSESDIKRELSKYVTGLGGSAGQDNVTVAQDLERALEDLREFYDLIDSAASHSSAAEMVWMACFFVVNTASSNRVVDDQIIDVIRDLCRGIPTFDKNVKQLSHLREAEQYVHGLYSDYMKFCSDCTYEFLRSRVRKARSGDAFQSARRFLRDARSSMDGRAEKFREVVRGSRKRQRAEETAEIIQSVPKNITDAPPGIDTNGGKNTTTVEFPVNTITNSRNSAFVGREDILEDMACHLRIFEHRPPSEAGQSEKSHDGGLSSLTSRTRNFSSQPSSTLAQDSYNEKDEPPRKRAKTRTMTGPELIILHGLGGVGKTQLALEFYYEYGHHFDACFWNESEHDWNLEACYALICDKLALLPEKTSGPGGHEFRGRAVEKVRTWLEKTERRWLLIFDNVEEFAELASYLPNECLAKSAVIVTTQARHVPVGFGEPKLLQVKELDTRVAADCLFKYMNSTPETEDERDLACQIVDHVGRLPLVMATIGGYIRQSDVSLAEFFESIKKKDTLWKIAPNVRGNPPYPRSMIDVFDEAFKELSPAARELLNVLSFMDPESIPDEILHQAIENKHFEQIQCKDELTKCRWELQTRHLVQRNSSHDDPYLSIHRILQWNVLLGLSETPDLRWQYFQKTFRIIQQMLPPISPLTVPEPEVWPPYARHGRQILELRTHCLWPEPAVKLPEKFAQILTDMGTYMWFSGKFPQGEEALETAERILDENLIPHNDALRADNYLLQGILTSFEGVSQRQRSMELRRRGSLARQQGLGTKPKEKLTREEDVLIWNATSEMAFGLIQEEDFGETANLMEDCLDQYRKWSTAEEDIPYEYAKYYQLISHCHMADGKPKTAIKEISRCLELMSKAAGQKHPMVQLIKFCEAILLWHAGKEHHAKALEIHKAVLRDRRKILGEFSQFTLESYSTCGKLCYEAGDLETAKEYFETCLQRRKKIAWNDEGITRAHFRHAKVLRALADQHRSFGRDEDASSLEQEAEYWEDKVGEVVSRYQRDYEKYLPKNQSREEDLDQMVSFWAGRFTGGLKQVLLDEDIGSSSNGGI